MRFLAAFLIGITVAASTATAAGKKPAEKPSQEDCEAHLQKYAHSHEGKPQDAATQWAMYLLELQQAYHHHLQELNANVNPFQYDLTLEDAQRKFDALSYIVDANDPLKRHISILGKAREFVVKTPQITLETSMPLLKEISAYSQNILKDDGGSKANLYRGSIALDLLLPALMPSLPQVELPNQPPDEKKPEKKKEEEQPKKKKKDPGQKQPAEYPEENGNYKPHTKDTDQEGGGEQTPLIISEINEPKVAYFATDYYHVITRGAPEPFQKAPLPLWNRPIADAAPSGRTLKINLGSKTEGILAMPVGWEPMQMAKGKPGKITLLPNGSYKITGSAQQTEIGVLKDSMQLGPVQMDFLRKPVGIANSEWPDDIRTSLLEHLKNLDPMSAAAKVESHIRNEYLYSVGPRPETDPIAALKALDPETGKASFQCDMAAYIMISIMRDYLKVPCIAVGGYRGSMPKADMNISHVKLPTEGHAWVRCFDNSGLPHDFDPTPKKKDKKKKNEDQKDEDEIPIQKEFENDPPEEPELGEDGQPIDKTEEHKKTLKENTEKRLKETQGKDGEKGEPSEGDGKGEKKDKAEKDKRDKDEKGNPSDGVDNRDPETSSALELGTLSLRPNGRGGMLENRARHLWLRNVMNPGGDAYKSLQALNRFKNDTGTYDSSVLSVVNRAERALMMGRQGGVDEAIMALSGTVKNKDLLESFKVLLQVEDRLDLYADMADPGEGGRLKQLVREVRQIKELFKALNDEARVATGMAEKFYGGLPMHAKRIVGDKYHITNIGKNMETQAMMNGIKSGELRDFNIMRTLYPLTDFIMDSTRAPATHVISLYQHDRRHFRGTDFLPVVDAVDIPRGFSLQPWLDPYDNMAQGTLILPGKFERVEVPDPGGVTQPHRVTFALYDTSGSMDGPRGDFQAALLATFIDRAAADKTAGGIHRHKALIAGFDTVVHSPEIVLNSKQAEDVIRNYRQKMKNTGGGTDIQKALIEGVNQIVEAEKEAGEPLASANILLLSDGGSTVDAEFIKKQLERVNRKTPVKFMFIAIGGTNQALIDLTRNALEAGAAEAYYKEFTDEHILQLLKEGNQLPTVNLDRELYTEKTAANLPKNLPSLLGDLGMHIQNELNRIKLRDAPQSLIYWQHEMSMTPILPDNDEPTAIKSELNRVRGLMFRSKVMKDRGFMQILVDDVMKNFKNTFGKPWTPLMVKEREHINHMIDYAIKTNNG